MAMDYIMIVTVSGKSYVVLSDSRSRRQIVRRDKIVTTTGTQSSYPQPKRQHLFLSLAGPPPK
jgi:hypothetical protein